MGKNATRRLCCGRQNSHRDKNQNSRQDKRRRFNKPPSTSFRRRRIVVVVLLLLGVSAWLVANPESWQTEIIYGSGDTTTVETPTTATDADGNYYAIYLLGELTIAEAADSSTYNRSEQFYSSWPSIDGCSLRQRIIKRDFATAVLDSDNCTVLSGTYTEPYTGQELTFTVRSEISNGIQIDHIVALSNAWQTGAQNLSADERYALATDPLNLVAADADANQDKSDSDASRWLPANRAFRCEYVARQISVKYKYNLWVTSAEHAAMQEVLSDCPQQTATL